MPLIPTGPRPDFRAVDYEAEIVQSAQLIETKLSERQIDYFVETLIMPYGSGYSYQHPQPEIHPGIVAACRQPTLSSWSALWLAASLCHKYSSTILKPLFILAVFHRRL